MATSTRLLAVVLVKFLSNHPPFLPLPLPLPQVRSLATHPQHARLFELVDIFAHKDLAAYSEWCSRSTDNSKYMAEQGESLVWVVGRGSL
jgi:hypothetical protein